MKNEVRLIFEKVISVIQASDIKYWIYGGIANAAMVGGCYRDNPDVDVFVLEDSFKETEEILEKLCLENGWRICKTFLNDRPKIEIFISGKEVFSLIPVYLKKDHVELIFREGLKEYPLDLLEQKERCLDGYNFFTINDKFLRQLFLEYLDSKKKYPPKRIEDARKLLNKEEFEKYFLNKNYFN